LDCLLAGVKGKRSPGHDSAAIMTPVYFNAEKEVGVRI